MEGVGGPVEILEGALLKVRLLELFPRAERALDDAAVAQPAKFRADEGPALAGLDMLELHDGPELAVHHDGSAVLELRGGNHRPRLPARFGDFARVIAASRPSR